MALGIGAGMVLSAGISTLGGIIGSQSSGASPEEMYDRQRMENRNLTRQYRAKGNQAAIELGQMLTDQNRAKYMQEYGTNWSNQIQGLNQKYDPSTQRFMDLTKISLPTLQNKVSVNLKQDPIYQQQVDQGMKQLNRRYGAMGSANSSDADNAVTRNMLDYYTNAYGRAESDLNRSNQNALTGYGLQYNRANDLYGRLNTDYSRDYNNIMGQYGIQSGAEQNLYQRLLANMQIGANSTAGAASNITNAGNTYAQTAMQLNQNKTNALQSGIAGVLGAYNNYSLYNYLNQNPAQQLPYSSGQGANNLLGYIGGSGIPGLYQ